MLEKYRRLRYRLLPFISSLAHDTYQTGSGFVRALIMDFPNDSKVADTRDKYMVVRASLVGPVTEEGAIVRQVYLPADAVWYTFWTNERLHGGQWIHVDAPIDTLPLFVRAGSILPLGSAIENTIQAQKIAKLSVYPRADADFTLYGDNGRTSAYEEGTATSLACTGTVPTVG